MAVTETTEQGWFSRIGDSIKGIFGGIILILVSIVILWWNEGRSVDRYNTIDFAKNNYVETPADSIDANNNEKLVHFNGMTATKDILTDKEFNVTVDNSLSLNRKVEMYQWKEITHTKTEKRAGGKTVTTTTYTYEKGWSTGLINSSSFKESGHDNPSFIPYKAEDVAAENVTLGAHKIPSNSASHLGSAVAVELDVAKLNMPVSAFAKGNMILFNIYKEEKAKQAKLMYENATPAEGENTKPAFNALQYQASEAGPQIGDVKITFTKHPVCEATVVAKQINDTIESFKTPSGDFYEVRTGLKTAQEVFAETEKENMLLTWGLRLLGFLLMWGGFGALLKPISVLADIIPLFGDIAETGISIISGLTSFALSMAVIAVAWLFYRPLLAICLFILMGLGIAGIIALIVAARAAKKAKTAVPAAEPAPEPAA